MNIKASISKFFKKKSLNHTGRIVNLYQTEYGKKALISYITEPFRNENHYTHQNHITSHLLAEGFSELGFDVDIVDYPVEMAIDYDDYAIIFGMGNNFERSFYSKKRDIPRILFVTGAHQDFQNAMGLKCVQDFYDLSGIWLPIESKVLELNTYFAFFESDLSIVLAQGFIFDDYRARFSKPLYSLNNNILGVFTDFSPKTIATRNKNFLYLSGTKQLAKGIHILLEVARLREDLNFYIVVFSLDVAIEEHYENLLKDRRNVFLNKNLRMDSAEMKQVVEACTYTLAPSYVDGFPGGTIEPMSAGLIPIVSKYCGFPEERFIFELEELSVEGLNEGMNKALALDDNTYIEYSNAAKTYIRENFTADIVKKAFKKIIKSALPAAANS